ncbi:MAG: transposase [Prolixibacteraceae bacterium]|nr:transposase [Prolixibacteraceae bacterium]
MILTRKIEIFISEENKTLRKEYYDLLYSWRYFVVNGANELLSYLYSIDRLRYYKFLTKKSKIELGIIGAKGEPVKESSAPYVFLSERMKGKIPMDILNCLQKTVVKRYSNIKTDLFKGNSSLYTFKKTIPIPFSACSIRDLSWNDELKSYRFTLFGISFGIYLGRDRSDNRSVIGNCLNGTFHLSESAIIIDDKRKKVFLSLYYSVPQRVVSLDEERYINASLSAEIPIIASYSGEILQIGNREEYLHRRLQIQAAIKRVQVNSRYSAGGKGRKRKLKAVNRFHNKEKNYINTRIHTYTKILIDYALANRCKTINLINQEEKEYAAKQEPFLLRNWSFSKMRQMIEYKARLYGIDVKLVTIGPENE